MRRRAAAAVICGVVLTIFLLGAGPASATRSVTIRQVDTTSWPTVKLTVLADGTTGPTAFNVRDGERLVADVHVASLAKSSVPVGTVLVIDASGSMVAGGRIEAARAAAHAFVNRMLPTEQSAIVAFNDEPRVLMPFTADRIALGHAIDAVQPHGETALWDGVRAGAVLLQAHPELQPNLVVLSDGKDTTSTSSANEARGAALGAKALVFTVGVGSDVDAGALSTLADATGGRFIAATAANLAQSYEAVQSSLQGQYELTYLAEGTDARDVTVSVGADKAVATVVPGAVSRGSNTKPATVTLNKAPGFLSGGVGLFLIVGLALAAACAAAWAIAMTVSRPRSQLSSVLAPYEVDETARLRVELETTSPTLVDSRLLRRAVDTAAKFEVGRSVVGAIEQRLEAANVPMRGAEALVLFAVAAVLGSTLVLLVAGSFTALIALAVILAAPPAVLSFLARRRRVKFTRQLPDALKLLSGTLRAGYSLMQGVETMAGEVGDPMGAEMKRVLAEARLGRGLDEALDDMAARLGSADFDWTVMAIGIQREVGGNLAELLETVAETMTSRERLRREVKALTAEGRMSAIVIGILPVALGALMFVLNPEYMSPLIHTSMGKAMTAGSCLMALFGFWWMKKTVDIEI
jgi:tight adherence protein B